MLARRAAELDEAGGARGCAPLWSGGGTRRGLALCGLLRGTPVRGRDETTWPAKEGGDTAARLQNWSCASLSTANFGRRGRLLREKIIGHGMRGLAPSIAVHRSFLHNRMLALLHQPARQQSRSILIEPGIEQLRDLFAEIGGVVQTRELVAVQGIARGREQKLPRRLSFVIHGDLHSWGATQP
jgi:hypothetical protein